MKKLIRNILILIPVLSYSVSFSQDYGVTTIPEELKEGMDAVTRQESGVLEIQALDKARWSVSRTVTVLNSKGSHNAYLTFNYDNFRSITSLSASVYNALGERINKIKKSNFNDESAISGGTFFDDSRVLWYDLRQDDFPYTIEYEVEYERKFTYSLPGWSFLQNVNESVEISSFTIKSSEEYFPRYETWKANDPVTTQEGDFKVLNWTETNLKGIELEPYDPTIYDRYPRVIVAPSQFEFEGYKGDMSTWEGIAKWQLSLNQGREYLPEERIKEMKALTNGLSKIEKIKKVYEYVQSNTRYVSVQLGVGGFQPMPAKLVDEEGYGDCKALSFYTQSLLKAIDVDAYYTKVYAGGYPPPINRNFPDHMSNHVILCVPNEADTIWLECTDQTIPFGFLGDFTSDREVFVITEEGGKIVRTPTYDIDDNFVHTNARVELFEDGNAKVTFNTKYSGLRYDEINGVLNTGEENQKKWLENSIDIPSFIMEGFRLENSKTMLPTAMQKVNLVARNLTSKSGTRYFLQPNLLTKKSFIPIKDDNRERPIHTGYSYVEIDSISYSLPLQYDIEAIFDPVEISSDFGDYVAKIIKVENGDILYVREFKKYKGVFEPHLYDEYIDFYKQVVRADKKRISFKKKT